MTYTIEDKLHWLRLYEQSGDFTWVTRQVRASRNTVIKALRDFGVPKGSSGGKRRPYGQAPNWSRFIGNHGYVYWKAHVDGRVVRISEHRLVMEKLVGRSLERWEQVHHRNGIKTDNRDENLEIVEARHHRPGASHCPHCGGEL